MNDHFKDSEAWSRLITLLQQLGNDSIWGLAIERSFSECRDPGELLHQLAEQVGESACTMEKIIGAEAVSIIQQHMLSVNKKESK